MSELAELVQREQRLKDKEAELEASRRALAQEKNEWMLQKIDLDRDILRGKAQLASLQPNIDRLEQQRAEKQARLEQLEHQLQTVRDETSRLDSDNLEYITAIRQEKASLTAEIQAVKERLAGQKALLDEGRTALAQQEQEHKARLAEAEANHLAKLEAITSQSKVEQQQHSDLRQQVAGMSAKLAYLKAEYAEQETAMAELKASHKALVERIAADTGEAQRIASEIKRLLAEQQDFRAYETKAWAALNAKDESLQAREEALIQREALPVQAKTFLPPRS